MKLTKLGLRCALLSSVPKRFHVVTTVLFKKSKIMPKKSVKESPAREFLPLLNLIWPDATKKEG